VIGVPLTPDFLRQHLPEGVLEQPLGRPRRWSRARLVQGRPWIKAWPEVGSAGVLETVEDAPIRHYFWTEKKMLHVVPDEYEEF